MKTVLLSLVLFSGAFAAMAIGVIVRRRGIKMSCHSMSMLAGRGDLSQCEGCTIRRCEQNSGASSESGPDSAGASE